MAPLKIAFYGKGGIGKSTIATNVSALLGAKGLKVLHIGCDPKADSTRLLTRIKLPTVLQQLDNLEEIRRQDLVFSGINGVQCVEAGGPEAGCGCAGLGIMTAMEELQRLGVLEENWDVIVYDVLGDVVCGGFSVPMRQHFVDKVYIVTSANFMSVYAANNILKGVKRYSKDGDSLCGGIIANHLKNKEEKLLLQSFCQRAGVTMAAELEEDFALQLADYQRNLFALTEDTSNGRSLKKFVESLFRDSVTITPEPMGAEELEAFCEEMGRLLYDK